MKPTKRVQEHENYVAFSSPQPSVSDYSVGFAGVKDLAMRGVVAPVPYIEMGLGVVLLRRRLIV